MLPVNEKKVAYLGPAGTHTHTAALSVFGPSAGLGFTYLPCRSITTVFDTVRKGEAAFGVAPLLNNVSGQVEMTFDVLLRKPSFFAAMFIVGSFQIHISHDLLGTGTLAEITTVYSKDEAFKQCKNSLGRLIPRPISEKKVDSTAAGIRHAIADGPESAVISSKRVCEFYPDTPNRPRLRALACGIQDREVNETRFIVFGKTPNVPSNKEQHSWFMFISDPCTSNLAKVLGSAHQWGIVPISLQSTLIDPLSDRLAYLLEIEGHRNDHRVAFFFNQVVDTELIFLGSSFQSAPAFVEWVKTAATCEKPDSFALLPKVVCSTLQCITSGSAELLDLYVHEPVTTVESVWGILGISASEILKTLVLMEKTTEHLLVCCVTGNQSIDLSRVNQYTGKSYVLCPQKRLADEGLTIGGISPLAFSRDVQIIMPPEIRQQKRIFMGAGRPDMSVSIDTKTLVLLQNVEWVDIAYAVSHE